jgi:hypothetical protein
MAELATTDAVLTAYFLNTNGVCDKLEASDHISEYFKSQLAQLDAKHAAGTAFTRRDCKIMCAALEQYLQNAI